MKFTKVKEAVKRISVTGTVTYWYLTLECGHYAMAIYSKNGWRSKTKPAPKRVVCNKCEKVKS